MPVACLLTSSKLRHDPFIRLADRRNKARMIRLGADESRRRPQVFAASSAELFAKPATTAWCTTTVEKVKRPLQGEGAIGEDASVAHFPAGGHRRGHSAPCQRSTAKKTSRSHGVNDGVVRDYTEAARRRTHCALDVPGPYHARGCGKLASNRREAFGRNVAPWESPCEQTARRRRALLLPRLAACEKGQITI